MFGTASRTITIRSCRVALLGFVVAGSLTTLTACASSDDDSATTAASETTTAVDDLIFRGAWVRTSPAGTTIGAAYVTITSPIDDALVGVAVDESIAAQGAEMHEMVMSHGSGMTESTMAGGMGEMTMQQVDRIELPAGEAVALAPGGFHIMLFGLVQPLEAGTTVELTFTFETAGPVTVEVPVLDEAPTP